MTIERVVPCWDEQARLRELKLYDIIGTNSEPQFDEIVVFASKICETSISLISLVEEKRQWFKARVGIEQRETPLDVSVCYFGILQAGLFVIPDVHADPRFRDNPLVTSQANIRFYAGVPIVTQTGYPLGMLCVIDAKERELNEFQKEALKVLAAEVMRLIEVRKGYYTRSDKMKFMLEEWDLAEVTA